MSPGPTEEFFATCAPGLEAVLHAEVRALGLAKHERQVGGVAFRGNLQDAWRANLELRTAVRVLQRVALFEARDADSLRAGAGQVAWERFLRQDGTFAVKARARDAELDNTMFVGQCVKDAIADRFRETTGTRPDVDKDDPHLRVHVHLVKTRCRLLVDTSGDSLHRRGWRRVQGRAPLAETLAAGVLALSGWDRRAPLLDPFCGSGTLLVEAALLADDRAPGLTRARFGFERFPGHDAAAWARMRELAAGRARPRAKLTLWGGDRDAKALEGAHENLAGAGLEGRVTLEQADARDFAPRPGWNGFVVSNLPYGERVGDARRLEQQLAGFGRGLRERCAGFHLALLSGAPSLSRALGIEFEEHFALANGGLDCELLKTRLG